MLDSDRTINYFAISSNFQILNYRVGKPLQLPFTLLFGIFENIDQNGVSIAGKKAGVTYPTITGVKLTVFAPNAVSQF